MPRAAGFQRQDPFAGCHDDPAQRDLPRLLHCGPDYPERLLRHFAVGRQIVGIVPVDAIDFVARNETLDIDRLGAFQLDRLDLVVSQKDVFSLGDFIAFDQIFTIDAARSPDRS